MSRGIDFLNIFDKDTIYKQEGASGLSKKRDSIDYDFGDWTRWLGASALGRGDQFTREALLEGSKAAVEERIADDAVGSIATIREGLTVSGIKDLEEQLKLKPKETEKEYVTRLAGLKNTANLVLKAELETPDFDRTQIKSGKAGAVTSLVRSTVDTTKSTAEAEAEQKLAEERSYQERLKAAQNAHESQQTNALYAHNASEASKLRAFETQQTNSRLAHESEQNNLTRQYQTDVAKYDANTKLQLARMESADRRADRAAAREDRLAAQRQASIMALVKGLTQMGAGFAI